ncbi:MAG: RNA polymerase III-inhibiting protein maf1 [Peltula sp. TS41687]|nr:MAG: RNA polymerase III-inhibiting protein maf1 [Peltula sp. TS41687]
MKMRGTELRPGFEVPKMLKGEDSSIWSFRYFFLNKSRKRVCYFYVRGLSYDSQIAGTPFSSPTQSVRSWKSSNAASDGPSERATYWLGYRGDAGIFSASGDDDDDEDDHRHHHAETIDEVMDDEVDVDDEIIDDGDNLSMMAMDDDDDDADGRMDF